MQWSQLSLSTKDSLLINLLFVYEELIEFASYYNSKENK